MNVRTTYILALTLLIVVGIFYFVSRRQSVQDTAADDKKKPAAVNAGAAERPLVDEAFGDDTVKIVCAVKDKPQWVFEVTNPENAGPSAVWKMTEPTSASVQDWMVRNIASTIARLKYTVVYKADQAGAVTPAQAGLEPPRATVTLSLKDGKSASVRIGRDASTTSAYVQLADKPDIYLVNASLKNVLKENAREYRNQRLADFAADKCVRLEVEHAPADGPAVTYTLVKSGTKWTFETPFRADAVTSKVLDAINTLSRLNAAAWVADTADKPGIYGLDAPELVLRATVEEPPPPPSTQPEGEKETPASQPVTKVHEIRISRTSPLGETDKRYIAKTGDPAVATIPKASIEKLTPDVSAWRDMTVTTAELTRATRVEITTPDGTGALEREGAAWRYADGSPADTKELYSLLNSIRQLKAQSFVDEAGTPDSLGFDKPQAELMFTLPGGAKPEQITVGGYADARTKRLVYVRSTSNEGVAKVLVNDAKPLLRSPLDYRDRQVIDFPEAQLRQLKIARKNPASGDPWQFTLDRTDADWKLTEPVQSDCDAETVRQLAQGLASLRAQGVADPSGEPAKYGLDAPDITVSVTRQPPEITRQVEIPPATQPTESQPADTQPSTQPRFRMERVQPPPETVDLIVSERNGTVYAKQANSPIVYTLEAPLHDKLLAEYRGKSIFKFEQPQVTAITVTGPAGTDGFTKNGEKWKYVPDADIPIDATKVTNLLVRISDLKLDRYVGYGISDADKARYGLDKPAYTVTIQADKKDTTLRVSSSVCEAVPGQCHYAMMEGSDAVFLVSPSTIQRFTISIDEFEGKPGAPPPPPTRPGMPPAPGQFPPLETLEE